MEGNVMSRITRVLAVSGLGLVAGLTLAGPAQASTSTTDNSSTSRASSNWRGDDDNVVGVYRSYRACEWAGERGERRGAWDDYDCNRVRYGWGRSRWELEVDCNSGGDWDDRGWRRHGHHGWDD
jgi:hypothetical protein